MGFCAVTVYLLLQILADFSHIKVGLSHSCSQVEAQIFEHDPIRLVSIADGAFPSLVFGLRGRIWRNGMTNFITFQLNHKIELSLGK